MNRNRTLKQLEHDLKNGPTNIDNTKYLAILYALNNGDTGYTKDEIKEKASQLTGLRTREYSDYTFKEITQDLKIMGKITISNFTELKDFKNPIIQKIKKKHQEYINNKPGRKKDGSSPFDVMDYFWLTPDGKEYVNQLQKKHPNINFDPDTNQEFVINSNEV